MLTSKETKSAETWRDEVHISEYRCNLSLHFVGDVRQWADFESDVLRDRGFTDVFFLVTVLLYQFT